VRAWELSLVGLGALALAAALVTAGAAALG
jgi:hypothetical protein